MDIQLVGVDAVAHNPPRRRIGGSLYVRVPREWPEDVDLKLILSKKEPTQ